MDYNWLCLCIDLFCVHASVFARSSYLLWLCVRVCVRGWAFAFNNNDTNSSDRKSNNDDDNSSGKWHSFRLNFRIVVLRIFFRSIRTLLSPKSYRMIKYDMSSFAFQCILLWVYCRRQASHSFVHLFVSVFIQTVGKYFFPSTAWTYFHRQRNIFFKLRRIKTNRKYLKLEMNWYALPPTGNEKQSRFTYWDPTTFSVTNING